MNKKFKNICLLLAMAICACGASDKKQVQDNQESKEKTEQQSQQTLPTSTQYGTNFQELTLEQALLKAKEENKLVFVDCYTKACIPCKKMIKQIFPQKVCGDYLNANYICITKDMEEPGEGVEIAKKYNVGIYPTFLILDPDGSKIFEVLGAINDAQKFVEKIKSGVPQAKQ